MTCQPSQLFPHRDLLLTFGLSLAVGLASNDPKTILIGSTLVNAIGGLIFLGSCMIGTPLTQVVGERFRNGSDATPNRAMHVGLSAMWGIGLLLEVAVRLVVISQFSVDVANGVSSAITLPVIGLLVLATIVITRRREQTVTP